MSADAAQTRPVPANPDGPLAEALARFNEDDLEQAYRACEAFLEHAPEDPRGLHLSGAILLKGGHFEGAINVLRRAALADPQNFEVWNNYATALRLEGRFFANADRGDAAFFALRRDDYIQLEYVRYF